MIPFIFAAPKSRAIESVNLFRGHKCRLYHLPARAVNFYLIPPALLVGVTDVIMNVRLAFLVTSERGSKVREILKVLVKYRHENLSRSVTRQ